MRRNTIRQVWDSGRPASNLWIDIGWPVTVEVLSRAPYDSFTIDLQHSLIDRGSLPSLLQALSQGPGIPMVRVSQNDPGEIGFALDAGAYGIICPTIETGEECRKFVSACLYPPHGGRRSFGPLRGMLYGGADYFDRYRDEILTIALVETELGIQNLDEIARTPGLDMIYLGPNDLGISYGAQPSYLPNHPGVDEAIDKVIEAARRNGIAAGIHAGNKEVASKAADKGYRLLSLGYASKIMLGSVTRILEETFGPSPK
jgi:4-hydroxy-2-oxoheptanedioate aldolase